MFGYVKVYQPELKMGEFEHYRGVYCALCKQLGKRYGFLARMTLSYDFTFLALFYMALGDDCPGFKKGRCAFNPLKKRTRCCGGPALEDAADAAALLVYYKTRDTIADSGFWKRLGARCLLPFVSAGRKKAARAKPELDAVMADCMRLQAGLEQAKSPSVDAAAEPTARMLAYLAAAAARDEREKRILDRFGYCLGRWIYLIDAADDLEEDLQNGSYNAFALSRRLTAGDAAALGEARRYAEGSLNATLAECEAAYNLLDIRRFDGILRNVLELGLPYVQKQALFGDPQSKSGKRRKREDPNYD